MGYQEIGKTADEKMVKTTNVFKHELSSLKAGRANPQILDRVVLVESWACEPADIGSCDGGLLRDAHTYIPGGQYLGPGAKGYGY